MTGYYVEVTVTKRKLIQLTRQFMPSTKELLRRARIARLPNQDRQGNTLESYIELYKKIPSEDDTICIRRITNGSAHIVQHSSGSDQEIKHGLRKIVQRHMFKILKQNGYKCKAFKI